VLDEEDLDLIGEANPEWERKTTAQVNILLLKANYRPLLIFLEAEIEAS
jgi:transcription elongation factor SPT6